MSPPVINFEDLFAAGRGDQAAAERIRQAQQQLNEQRAAIVPETLVAANALILHPCLTRDLIAQRSGFDPNDSRFFSMMTFDDLGCRIDPVFGWRIHEDCKPGGYGETRSLCPGVARDISSGNAERLAKFAKTIAPIVQELIPLIGPGLSELLSPLITKAVETLGLTGSSALGEEVFRLIETVRAAAFQMYSQVPVELRNAAEKTFATLSAGAKSIADALPTGAFGIDPKAAAMLAYSTVREGLSFASHLLKGDEGSIGMLHALAVNAPFNVHDFASARIAQDAKKTLVAMQNAADFVQRETGGLVPQNIDNLIRAEMPALENFSAQQLSTTGLTGLPLSVSADLVTKYAGKPGEMIAALDPNKLAALVPNLEGARTGLVARMRQAIALDVVMAPYIREAEQSFGNELRALKASDWQTQLHKIGPYAQARSFERDVRAQLASAQQRADRIIQRGIALHAPFELGIHF